MKDLDRLLTRFHEFGGWRLVRTYARMHVLGVGCRSLVRCALKGKSFKEAYPKILERVEGVLLHQYGDLLNEERGKCPVADGPLPKIIWTGWLQGVDRAPDLVKACWQSQCEHFAGYEQRILTLDNYRQWVTLPEEVVERYERGQIPAAHFCDLLRFAVLHKYGGVWLDATVFCTGMEAPRQAARWFTIEESPLTIFRYYPEKSLQPTGLSTWFIAARPRTHIIDTVLRALLAYWNDYDCLVDYYHTHLFLSTALRNNPAYLQTMPRANSRHSLLLADALSSPYNEDHWQDLVEHVCFHKLNFRKVEPQKSQTIGGGHPHTGATYLDKILGGTKKQ